MKPRKLYYSLSPSLRKLARLLFFFPIDIIDSLRGKRYKYEPPKGKIFVGYGDFMAIGKNQMNTLQEHTHISADQAVLDIGCGIGRTAVPLTNFLSKKARYEGFDVMKEGIDWCTKKITKDYPNFTFKWVNLGNDLYNSAKTTGENFKFPYEANTFDTSFLFSVFTHMQPAEVSNYLKEIYRTLHVGGECLATFFTYDKQIEVKISSENGQYNFSFDKGRYRLMSDKVKSANVAFHKDYLMELIADSGLTIKNTVDGYWKAKVAVANFQDVYVLVKSA